MSLPIQIWIHTHCAVLCGCVHSCFASELLDVLYRTVDTLIKSWLVFIYLYLRKKLMYFFFLFCLVADHLGCDPQTRFFVPPNIKQWIALLQRGNCTFKEKISRAAFHNAVAVVIYNNKSKEEPVTMTHPGKQEKELIDMFFLVDFIAS